MDREKVVVGFSPDDAEDLLASLGKTSGQPPVPRGRQGGYIALTPVGGIPKRVGNTVTFVDCDIYYLEAATSTTRTLTSTGVSLPVGNMSEADDVAGSAYILCGMYGGELVAPWEDC